MKKQHVSNLSYIRSCCNCAMIVECKILPPKLSMKRFREFCSKFVADRGKLERKGKIVAYGRDNGRVDLLERVEATLGKGEKK